jgi:PAS domain-containing protein
MKRIGLDSINLVYYDRLSLIFEKTAWATLLWALGTNLISPTQEQYKNLSYMLLLSAAVFTYFYFRYYYPRFRQYSFRFFAGEVIYPLFIWSFLHVHNDFLKTFMFPYFVVILATSVTLKRVDSFLTLGVCLVLITVENLWPVLSGGNPTILVAFSQLTALAVFAYLCQMVSAHLEIAVLENLKSDVARGQQTEKASILKRFSTELVLDKQKAQLLVNEYPNPLMIVDDNDEIIEVNEAFEKLCDFKDGSLPGRTFDYVLQYDTPLTLNQESFLPEPFSATITTRRNKTKKVTGKAYFLLGSNKRLRQTLLLFD